MFRYCFMTFACPQYSLADVLSAAAQHGYAGIEPRLSADHAHGIETGISPAQCTDIRRQCDDAGVAIACLATSVRYNFGDASLRAENVATARAVCELAAEVGAKRVRVFGGMPDDDADRDSQVARVTDGLRACVETAAACDVVLCLETHDAFCAGKDVARVCAEVDSPQVQATWDVQHPITVGERIEDTRAVLMPLTRHVHFHDTDRRESKADCVAIGAGQAPVLDLLRVFKEEGYDGYLSGEWFYNNGPEKDLADFIGALRSLEESL